MRIAAPIILLCMLATGASAGQYDPLFKAWGASRSVDWRLLKAVAMVESSFRPCVVSRRGAIGLMQVLPLHARIRGFAYPRKALCDPDINIRIGSAYLTHSIALYGQNGGLHAYNVGRKGYRDGRRNWKYVQRVLRWYRAYKEKHP